MKKIVVFLLLIFSAGCQGQLTEGEGVTGFPVQDLGTNIEIEDAGEEVEEIQDEERDLFLDELELLAYHSEKHPELASTIHEFLERYRFNGVALVATGEEIILHEAYGTADQQEGIPMTVDRKFQIASVSKSFAAVGILQLQERGLLSVHDTLDGYFPGLVNGDNITIHHLMTHSSGLFAGDNLGDYSYPATPEELTRYAFREPFLLFSEPGSQTRYSNLGYHLLGMIIEMVSGLSFEEYMEQYVLRPANMAHSGLNTAGELLPGVVTAHLGHASAGDPAPWFHPSTGFAAGGLHATALDLFRYTQALQQDLLIDEGSFQAMTRGHYVVGRAYHGYGWFIDARGIENTISHTGVLWGWRSILISHLDNDVTVVLLANHTYNDMALGYTIANLVLTGIEE